MSILSSTNSGIENTPLTPEVAKALGWYIEKDNSQNANKYGDLPRISWRCIDMKYKDEEITAPLRFWYEPKNKLKYIKFQFWFFAQEELGLDTDGFNHCRHITTVKELKDCLGLVYLAQECENKMKRYWNSKLKHLKKRSLL